MSGWTELPPGYDVIIRAGVYYSAIARVKKNHTTAAIISTVKSMGLEILTLDDPYTRQCDNTSDNYRCVAVNVKATRDGVAPWGSPIPLLDETSLQHVWYSADAPLPTGGVSKTSNAPWWLAGLAVVGIGGVWWWRRKHRRLSA